MTGSTATLTPTSATSRPVFDRDAIRTAVLDSKPYSELVPFAGVQIELRAPSLLEMASFRDANATPGDVDPEIMGKSIIRHCYVPDTNGQEKVFEDTDLDVIMGLYYTPDMKNLLTRIMKMLGDDNTVKEGIEDHTKSPEAESSNVPDNEPSSQTSDQ